MESDRELIEFAAKAAGLTIDKSSLNGGGCNNTGFDMAGNAVLDWHNGICWNPLENDGDALRLAVKLRLFHVYSYDMPVAMMDFDATDPDPYTATRRAIVRAAAEIGKTLG